MADEAYTTQLEAENEALHRQLNEYFENPELVASHILEELDLTARQRDALSEECGRLEDLVEELRGEVESLEYEIGQDKAGPDA